jgi:hypothetical protein
MANGTTHASIQEVQNIVELLIYSAVILLGWRGSLQPLVFPLVLFFKILPRLLLSPFFPVLWWLSPNIQ